MSIETITLGLLIVVLGGLILNFQCSQGKALESLKSDTKELRQDMTNVRERLAGVEAHLSHLIPSTPPTHDETPKAL